MWSEALLSRNPGADVARPRWLGPSDAPWVEVLLARRAAAAGLTRADLARRLDEPLEPFAPKAARALVARVLVSMGAPAAPGAVKPRAIRAAVFAAAREDGDRAFALRRAAEALTLSVDEVESLLFADLGAARLVPPLPVATDVAVAIARANEEIARGVLANAVSVRVEAEGSGRDLVRHARARGLLALVPTGGWRPEGIAVELSGPFSLFQHTALYGRALAGLLPILARMRAFRLLAKLELRGGPQHVELTSRDPIGAASTAEPARAAVAKLVRELRAQAATWEIRTDPEPVDANGVLLFPDLAAIHRSDGTRLHVEVCGFWTADRIRASLRRLRETDASGSYLFCLDESRNCGSAPLPADAPVLRYARVLEAQDVLRKLEEMRAAQATIR